MQSNLEQIIWQLLPPVLTQNAKQFRTNYLQLLPPVLTKKCEAIQNKLPGSCCHWYWHKMWSNLEQITWQLLPPVLTQNAKQVWTNYLATASTILALNVKQCRMNYLPLLPQYWHKNVKQFRANYLVAECCHQYWHKILKQNCKEKNLNRKAVATNTILCCCNSVATFPKKVYTFLGINYLTLLQHYCTK